MARTSGMRKLSGVVFSMVIAPVLVNVVEAVVTPSLNPPPSHSPSPVAAAADRDGRHEIVLSQGSGFTQAEARQAAIRAALQKAIVLVIEPSVATPSVDATCDVILRSPEAILLRVNDCGLTTEPWNGANRMVQRVSVDIARSPLEIRLQALGFPVRAR